MNNLYFNEYFFQIRGHFAPQLANLIYERNEKGHYINLKRFMLITIYIFFTTLFLPTL